MKSMGFKAATSRITVTLALLGTAVLAMADPSRQVNFEWLHAIALAAHQTNYSGTFVHQYGNRLETSHITHVFDQSGEQGKLKKQNSSDCEVTHNNSEILCYSGKKNAQRRFGTDRKVFPVLLPEQLATLNENYLIRIGESANVAGFDTQVVELRPKDNLRYSHKMWAHKDSGLLLKAAVLSDRQEVVEQYTFVQLKITSNNKQAGLPSKPLSPPQAIAVLSESVWKVDALPPGFKKVTELRRPMRGKKGIATQLVFSDGLVGISVFIENRVDNPDSTLGLSSEGAIHIYSKLSGDYLVTVVGEVPPSTVLQVADSVRNRG